MYLQNLQDPELYNGIQVEDMISSNTISINDTISIDDIISIDDTTSMDDTTMDDIDNESINNTEFVK
ncbi:hypothetical protein F8M41_017682 [Gigaspora margarita]|uniref:Uncharacterized protein n=1 Tax=Gigaspora margarita TaxID=4874 RepID=A0A8H3WRX5_GIGMA|nr:hypothetical protein F8M41_017682 [Gigaspora margarita]